MRPAYDYVKTARSSKRLTGIDYIHQIFTDFIELHGDRRFADDPAVIGGIARFDGMPVTVIATEKGKTTKERLARNFGAPNPEGYRKALRLMKQAEKFGRPIICFVDTSGAFCGIGAEERGQGQAIAENLSEMMMLRVPVLSILIGEGGSGGALALAVANDVWMMENAVYSVISPEGCASILWKDASKAAEAAKSLKITASDVLNLGVIEKIIPEYGGDAEKIMAGLHTEISAWYNSISSMTPEELIASRQARFRKIGNQKPVFDSVQTPSEDEGKPSNL
jgi:acetyl-CoA carboxylase carboxyl transferase subunit alpha